jgi:TP901 family phage tail tape measure protein
LLNNLGLGFVVTAKDLSKSTFEQVQKSLGTTGIKAGEVSKETKEAAEVFNQASYAMGIAGAAIIGVLGLAADKAHELEEAFKLVATRADAAGVPMEGLEESALSLSNAFGVDQTAIAKGYYEALGKGATDAASAEAVLTASTHLAVGGHIELAAAVDATTQVLRAFHMPMEDAAKVSDQLIVASRSGAGSIEELSGALEHLGPVAARANLGSEDLLGAVTALSNAGLKGRAGIGGLRAVLEAMVQPTDAAKQEARALGVTLDSAKIAAMGFGPWIESLSEKTHGSATAMAKLFGSAEASTAALALMRNGGEDLNKALDQVTGSTGAAADAADKMTDQWTRAKALTTNALAALGKAFLPLLDAVLKPINAAIEGFTHLSPGIQKAIGFGLLFVGVTLLIAGGIAGMIAGIAAFGATVAPVLAVAGSLLLPIAGIMAAIAVAAYALKVAWDRDLGGIRTTVTQFYEKVKLVWEGVSQLFSQGGFSGSVLNELNKAGNGGIKEFVVKLFLWGNRIKAFWDGLTDGISAAFDAAAPIFHTIGEIFGELADAIGTLFGGANSPDKNAAAFRAFAEAGKAVGDALGFVLRMALTVVQIALIPMRLIVASLTGGWAGFRRAALESFADVVKGLLGMATAAAGIADHLAAAFGKDLGAAKAVGDFAKTVDAEIRPSIAVTATAAAGGDSIWKEGAKFQAPRATIGRDSAAVQEAYAANARIRGGETGAGAASDKAYIEKMVSVLEAIRANGNQPVVVKIGDEEIARAVKANQDAHADRGFAPRAPSLE